MYLAFERGARHKDVLENTLGGERRILRRIIERLMGGTDAESYRVGCGEGGHDVKETFFSCNDSDRPGGGQDDKGRGTVHQKPLIDILNQRILGGRESGGALVRLVQGNVCERDL